MEDAKTQEKILNQKHKNRMKEIEAEKEAQLAVIQAELNLENVRYDHIMSNYRIKRADRNRDGGQY